MRLRALLGALLALAAAAVAAARPVPPPPLPPPAASCAALPDARPPPGARTFTSAAVDAAVASLAPRFADAKLGRLFANTLPHVLDACVARHVADDGSGAPDTFLITGDIPAMWLRDASAQAAPYVPFAATDAPLRRLLAGLLARMARCVLLDPYANAFALDPDAPEAAEHASDDTRRTRGVFERKWELDSLAAPLSLAEAYFNATHDAAPFVSDAWLGALRVTVGTMRAQQASSAEEDASGGPPYTFRRSSVHPSETLLHGRGAPARRTGLVRSAFRPSDDATTFPFHVPDNAAAAASLRGAARMLRALPPHVAIATTRATMSSLAADADALAIEIEAALRAHAVITLPPKEEGGGGEGGGGGGPARRVYAYEVDGYGSAHFMDDANSPSLLSLPLHGTLCASDDEGRTLCAATREAALSNARNAYYASGDVASGVGSPHTGSAGRAVWPLALVTRAATSEDDAEIADALAQLVAASACTGLVHESFDPNNATAFTRPWFAWGNAAAGGLLLRLAQDKPHLVLRQRG
jgi:meiotically up-regulated gene 157 (Mug157) protein